MAHLNSYANVATLFANIDSIKKYPEFTEVCEFIRYADWNSFILRNVSISGNRKMAFFIPLVNGLPPRRIMYSI